MTQAEINRAVAKATGETTSTIAQRGFSIAHWIPSDTGIPPIDWDLQEAQRRTSLFPDRQRYRA